MDLPKVVLYVHPSLRSWQVFFMTVFYYLQITFRFHTGPHKKKKPFLNKLYINLPDKKQSKY